MKRTFILAQRFTLIVALAGAFTIEAQASKVDTLLAKENAKAKQPLKQARQVDELTFLRRVSIDIIGRIPARAEIEQFQKWPDADRRSKAIDKLLSDPRFADVLSKIDWAKMGEITHEMSPVLAELVAAMTEEGAEIPMELAIKVQQLNSQLLGMIPALMEAGVPGFGANGSYPDDRRFNASRDFGDVSARSSNGWRIVVSS